MRDDKLLDLNLIKVSIDYGYKLETVNYSLNRISGPTCNTYLVEMRYIEIDVLCNFIFNGHY